MPETMRRLRDLALDLIYRAILRGALALPYRRRVPLMGWAMRAAIAPVAGYRRRVRENLALVLPDLPAREARRMERAVPDNVGRALIEIYSGAEFVERVRGLVPEGPGLEALEKARAEGAPAILATGHFGNYDAPRAWLAANGFPIAGFYSPMHNEFFNAHYVAAMESIGKPMFPRDRSGISGMIRHLKSGGFQGMVVDQHVRRGAPLSFFGVPAMTALSPAEMSLKYDAALVPIYGIRQPDGLGFSIRIEAPIPRSDPAGMTQALNDSLEALVRTHPDQWMWIHRRWKLATARASGGKSRP